MSAGFDVRPDRVAAQERLNLARAAYIEAIRKHSSARLRLTAETMRGIRTSKRRPLLAAAHNAHTAMNAAERRMNAAEVAMARKLAS